MKSYCHNVGWKECRQLHNESERVVQSLLVVHIEEWQE